MATSATLTRSVVALPQARTVLAHLIFWSWNGLFLLFVGAGLAPQLLAEFARDTARGLLPLNLALTLAAALVIPVAATAVGLFRYRRQPESLFCLFFGLELPLFFLCLGRLFLLQQITPPVAFVGLSILAGLGAFAFELEPGLRPRGVLGRGLQLAFASLLMAVAAWACLLVAFIALPLVPIMLRELPREFHGGHDMRRAAIELIGLTLGGLTALLFVAMPGVTLWLSVSAWRRVLRDFGARVGGSGARALAASVVALFALGFWQLNLQPQRRALALLSEAPRTASEQRARLAASDSLRDGLLNAYLARHRYAGAAGEASAVSRLYAEGFGGSREDYALVQELVNWLGSPWLYDGVELRNDSVRAAALYESFFDAPIEKGEQAEVQAALTASFDRARVAASLVDRDARHVLLRSQSVSVEESGDQAEVLIHEAYENQTFETREVLYYFALPETAVVTGLWLGESDDRAEAFEHVVAPRGAAQRVYLAEQSARRDPALLEEVGPLQYRLRVFPIPARSRDDDALAQPMHLWLRYRVLAADGGWPLPRLIEKRNVYWTSGTERSIDGRAVRAPGTGWLPERLPAAADVAAVAHEALLRDGTRVRATPFVRSGTENVDLPAGRIAIVLDRSLSMEQHARAVEESLGWLRRALWTSPGLVDIYLTSAPARGEPAELRHGLDAIGESDLGCYGGMAQSDLVEQFEALAGDRIYGAVVVLTDAGGFELEQAIGSPLAVGSPLWLVHLGGAWPNGYADEVLRAIQVSGGGVSASLDEALGRAALSRRSGASVSWLADGYLWEIEPGDHPPIEGQPFAPFAARQVIERAAGAFSGDDLATLDRLHELAREHDLVTAWSSLLVLVNDAQRGALERANAAEDRFQRAVEDGASARLPLEGVVSAVPEPEDYLLALVVAALLAARLRGWRRARLGGAGNA